MAGLTLTNVIKRFGTHEVIHGANLEVADGEFVVFVGPSGCGKSTLLRMIAGLEDISDGTIEIGGTTVNDVEASERRIAMVFQSYALYPHMTVRRNLSFGLQMSGNPQQDTERRVAHAANILQINDLMDRRPGQISGGQRQRVAIGRAIVREPQVFLFDEPLSNLDAELRVQMRVEISRLHKQLGTTMIYVTHDQTEAMTLADKIVVLRAGRIEQVGAPLDLYDNPANQFVAGFVGSPKMNFLKAKVEQRRDSGVTISLVADPDVKLTLPLSSAIPEGSQVTLGIRPEHFLDAGAGDADLTGRIDVAEHLGHTSYVYATLADESLIIERPESRHAGQSDRLTIGLSAARSFLFDAQGNRLR
ncbi:sn-glycerol-3-phosphate ABC transporter ATP-binding protein UgpC [Phyllobacterium sp. 0TCS1.6C]|uniref:ABC transporter ATP-binding protein n=1 Tax=unclassified Phyllobacterium TaxID=2638441 RepID=UPI0022652CBF|nr:MULTISPECIES: sn-glycerol-3-phosphate ABC transporter ATP-binding protein UgpC [unclassified Phyllobacterium]MCX8279887.1 sn-glycerol-3-phosphate ABC transporter ATP-binding protein UgpC [Phyllobacterium sp. 0TCS1.6C]MCX8295509.1 sn-glycerol-3-phosphate ABC transporter ATP-binding protein UgpC [Phyllobacterium sp. 0TCS1.6A]